MGVAKTVSVVYKRDNFQDEIPFPMIFGVRWLYKIGPGAVFETTRIKETFTSGPIVLGSGGICVNVKGLFSRRNPTVLDFCSQMVAQDGS
jgi:hypothetical protein